MKRLFAYADQYMRESDWKTMALVKFCLFSMGLLVGSFLPENARKGARFCAYTIFIATYVPLMTKFAKIVFGKTTTVEIPMEEQG